MQGYIRNKRLWNMNCPHILASGTCPNASECRFNHSVLACEPCGYIAPDRNAYGIHLNTNRHRQLTKSGSVPFESWRCTVCEKNIGSTGWHEHIASRKHRLRAKVAAVDSNVAPAQWLPNEDVEVYCPLCRHVFPKEIWAKHLAGSKHQRKESFVRYRSMLDEAERDKHDVMVEGTTDLGFLDPASIPQGWEGEKRILVAKCANPAGTIKLVKAELSSNQGSKRIQSGFSLTSVHLGWTTPATPAFVHFKFVKRPIGRYEDRLELTFEDTSLKIRFVIIRILQVVIGNQTDHETLGPSSPYIDPRLQHDKPVRREPEGKVIPGVPPPSLNAVKYVTPLPMAKIPKSLLEALSKSEGGVPLKQQIEDIRRMFLPSSLTPGTHARYFKILLWVEEYRTEADLQRYDMKDATLSKQNSFYFLAIPGLAEKRPSVLVGDRILFQHQNLPTAQWYEGHVHLVRQSDVGLCFHTSFSVGGWSPAQKYNVRFKLNRIVLRRQHQALDMPLKEGRALFPIPENTGGTRNQPSTRRMDFFNPLIGANARQAEAVKEITSLPPGSVPFVVFGPPGTGKTVTIVEAIRQLLHTNPDARILACTPSNSAADLITERLSSALSPIEMFRMYAPSRPRGSVPNALHPYVFHAPPNQTQQVCFGVPPVEDLKKFKVIVSTCIASSMLSGVGVPRGHFNWLFVDEAGQATEPELCVPLKTLVDRTMNTVLSGDPKQLGPMVRSAIAKALGLEKSYLERLMERDDVYGIPGSESGTTPAPGQAKAVVKLTQNFRSHPSILSFPNGRFYGGDLVACGAIAMTHAYLGSPVLPPAGAKFPIVFHSVIGKDDREASSPSFFNVDEVSQVKSYVQQLKAARGQFMTADGDIGVITPYHKQCIKLRAALKSVAGSVKVGSVEEFQGQERKVIIISTVRSSREFVNFDLRYTLGFVANPRRFNVAVTRAKALLVIVGNPHVLGLDPLWKAFLGYIHENGGWTGSPDIPWDPQDGDDGPGGGGYGARVRKEAETEMDELARRVREVSMDASGEEDVNIDRPWREQE